LTGGSGQLAPGGVPLKPSPGGLSQLTTETTLGKFLGRKTGGKWAW